MNSQNCKICNHAPKSLREDPAHMMWKIEDLNAYICVTCFDILRKFMTSPKDIDIYTYDFEFRCHVGRNDLVEESINVCNAKSHLQQAAYSIHAKALTQVCFRCRKVVSSAQTDGNIPTI